MKYIIVISLSLSFVSSAIADQTTQAVNDYCACAKPAYKKHKEVMAAFKKHINNPKKAEEIFKNMEKDTASLAKCFQDLNEKYKTQQKDVEFQKKVNVGIQKQCPKPKMEQVMRATS